MESVSSKVNINVSMYIFKYYVKLFLLENELLITYHYYYEYKSIRVYFGKQNHPGN